MGYFEDNLYSFIRNVEVYAATGAEGDTLAAADWKNNLIFTGDYYIPHGYPAFVEYYSGKSSVTIWDKNGPTAEWTRLVGSTMMRGVLRVSAHGGTQGRSGLNNIRISKMSNGILFHTSTTTQNLVIVRVPESKNVYFFDWNEFSVAQSAMATTADRSYWIEEQADGSLILNKSRPMLMPRVFWGKYANTGLYYAKFPTIIGLSDDGYNVQFLCENTLRGVYPESEYVGSSTYFHSFTHFDNGLHQTTIDFLNTWPLNGAVRETFSPNCFTQGLYTGQRLKLHKYKSGAKTGTISAGAGEYDEKSFLSGLAAGFTMQTIIY